MNEEDIRSQWPLHWLIWNDDSKALNRLLGEKEHDIEALDPRGRTPLHLAVTLGRIKCVEALLHHNANSLALNRHKWAVLHEAVCTGNPELIGMVLRSRDQQQKTLTTQEIPLMLERLRNASDFYIEMKWEFSSWVPFVSRMCPSDTYRIWKKGTTVRVDTTLVGFEHFTWQRGHQTLMFQATESGHRVCDIDHDKKTVWEKEIQIMQGGDPIQTLMSQEMGVLHRLNSPVVSTYLDTEAITFQRQRSGIWGFRSDKVEDISGHKAKVFTATGLDIVTNTRVEHLPETEKKKHKSINPLQDFLGAAHDHAQSNNLPAIEAPPTSSQSKSDDDGGGAEKSGASNKPRLSLEEYFTEPKDKTEYDVLGRAPEVSTRMQKLKATVCLAEDFPLSLQEQIMPIIDLMSLNTPHFAKVKDFINLQMPSGFPIKFEIPLFHVMSAKVTFCNLNGKTQPAPFVSLHTERVRTEPEIVTMATVSTSSSATEGIKRRHTSSLSEDHNESSVDQPPSTSQEEGEKPNYEGERGGVAWKEVCQISDDCFAVPSGYRKLNQLGGRGMIDEEEELLQLAIRQSLLEQSGGGGNEQLSLTEALRDEAMLAVGDPQRQSAVRQSLVGSGGRSAPPRSSYPLSTSAEEDELQLALALSQQMAEEEERERRQRQLEDEELEKVLKLSLTEK